MCPTRNCLTCLVRYRRLQVKRLLQPEPKWLPPLLSWPPVLVASSGDDWVTESSIAADARKTNETQEAVIDSNMKRTAIFARDWLDETEDTPEDLKELMLLWQNDHTALRSHVSLLTAAGLRVLVQDSREQAREQRRLADNAFATVRRLVQQ
jgi:hypothetical protein